MIFISNSEKETEKIGIRLAKSLSGREVIALYGKMGAGKTAFVRGIVEYFKIKNLVSSPTFSIVNEYKTKDFKIYHFDMYRINSWEGLESTGFFDYLDTGILIIEWSENVESAIPEDRINVTIEKLDDKSKRKIIIEGEKAVENFSN